MSNHAYTGLFKLHPTPGTSIDGFVSHDKELIKQSVKNIIMTHKGSRVYDPDYGTNLHKLVHELNIERIRNIAKTEIQTVIEKYEPRAIVKRIEAVPKGELEQQVLIIMTLFYVEYETEEILEIQLKNDNTWMNDTQPKKNALEAMFQDSMK